MKYVFSFFLLALFSNNLLSQNCSCSEAFKKISDIIESDYAGFNFKIKSYKINYPVVKREKISEILKKENVMNGDCGYLLYQYLDQFRDGHISFAKKTDEAATDLFTSGKLVFPFKKKANSKNELFEGVWYSKSLQMVCKIERAAFGYSGKIIYTKSTHFKPGQTRFYIVRSTLKSFTVISLENYFTGDRVKVYSAATLKNDSLLLFKNSYSLKRLKNKVDYDSLLSIRSDPHSYTPTLKIIDNSIVLKIPSFDYENKKVIDSLCNQLSLLSNYRNLILDLRGNSGGTIECIYPLEKYIYTGPFSYVAGYKMASDSAIKFYGEYAAGIDDKDTEAKKTYTELYTKMKNNRGALVYTDDSLVVKQDSIYRNPEKIAIIVDGNCASAVELVLLAIRNSKKVVLFGETTAGVVDTGEAFDYTIQNCNDHYFLSVPDVVVDFNKYKSFDGIGIQPDFYINTISENCISEVLKILNKK
jgi:hypothetical protein